MTWLIYVLAALAGAINPAQAAANAELKKALGQVISATLIVYLSGLAGMLLILPVFGQPLPTAKLGAVPWWAWTGGLLSIGATMAGAGFAQKLGSGVFTGISVTASLVVSLLLDQFGWMGFKVHPASWPRLVGGLLMVIGLWMAARF